MAAIAFGPRALPGPKIESYVSRLLDEAGAPGFIWGESALLILGVPTVQFFSGWVVPDDCIEQASRALTKANFPPCTQGRECSIYWKYRTHPIPDYHYHTDLCYPEDGKRMTKGVFLYKKSRLFWSFPDPPVGPPAVDDPYYMLTSDNRLGEREPKSRARALAGGYSVKMLVPAKYIEGMLLLLIRDLVGKRVMSHWQTELGYLGQYVLNEKDNPAATVDDVAEPFRRYFKILHGDDGQKNEQETDQETEQEKETAVVKLIEEQRKKELEPPTKKDMLKDMENSLLSSAYLHQLYVSMKSNN